MGCADAAALMARVFDAPVAPPSPAKPFRPLGADPWLAGPVPARLRGGEAWQLTAFLTRLGEAASRDLTSFGSLWLDDRPCPDPAEPLAGHGKFRLNPPAYGPLRFYEADPGRIAYEDKNLLAYNKESGRPSQGVPYDNYNNALAALTRLRGQRLWLLHRLDADTSGLLLFAKTREAAGLMGREFQRGAVRKEYWAVGAGRPPAPGQFTRRDFIAKQGPRYVCHNGGPGLPAATEFTLLAPGRDLPGGLAEALFLAVPRTGRTHQIRLHLAAQGWPVRGDRFYGRPGLESDAPAPRLMLAAVGLAFTHPLTGGKVSLSLAPEAVGRQIEQ